MRDVKMYTSEEVAERVAKAFCFGVLVASPKGKRPNPARMRKEFVQTVVSIGAFGINEVVDAMPKTNPSLARSVDDAYEWLTASQVARRLDKE